MVMAKDDLPFELGDNPCEDCGEQNWRHVETRERGDAPTKHFFECEPCSRNAYVFDGDGALTFTGAFEHAGQRYGDAENPRYSRGV